MELRGIIPAMVTPLHEDESIHVEELKNQVNRQIAAGAAALFCLGTNGEFYALSHEEKKLVMKTVAEENHGRLPILAGTGCITTKETIELTLYAKELGYDAVSVIAPYFAESSQDMLVQHYTNVAAACQMPIILYNIPARTGVNNDMADGGQVGGESVHHRNQRLPAAILTIHCATSKRRRTTLLYCAAMIL